MVNGNLEPMEGSTYDKRSETFPLLNKASALEANIIKEWPKRTSDCRYSGVILSRRPAGPFMICRPSIYIIATAAVCLGLCAVLFHPHKVSEFAVSIRRCLLGKL